MAAYVWDYPEKMELMPDPLRTHGRPSGKSAVCGLASSYPATARPSYKEGLFESIELMMIDGSFWVEDRMNARLATEVDGHGRPQETFPATITIN